MSAQYHPKTLAKILSSIAWHTPAEFGLFWDADGSMPWKEFYWALQEDASLRFVREGTIRELVGLGMDLPFVLDGARLRLLPDAKQVAYPLVESIPERLFFACRRKQYASVLEHGLAPAGRPWIALAATKELALRLGRRRDPEPILIDVLAAGAQQEGEAFYWAGGNLYLVGALPPRHLLFPLLRVEQQAALTSRKKSEGRPTQKEQPITPGSFFVDVHHFEGHPSGKDGAGLSNKQKGRKKSDWKREAKKERHKRSI